jgi:hypothetical protein
MSEHASNSAGRDYEIPIVWHEPVEFDMAECAAETQNGGSPKSPSGPPSRVKKRPKATKKRRKR